MKKIKNLNFSKKNLVKVLISLGVGGALVLSAKTAGLHFDSNGTPNFYYINTKNIDMSNEELLDKFQEEFQASSVLKKEFSEIYPEISKFISEYGSYLDQEQLLDTISELDVEQMDDDKYGKSILAYYSPSDNTIYLKNRIKYKKDSKVKEIKEHEFFHYLFFQGFSQSFTNFSHTGHALDEGMVTLLTQETGDFDDAVCYKKNANYVRVICELIGSQNFMEACGSHSLDKLIDYLSENSSKSDAKELIKCIDKACTDQGYIITEDDQEAWSIIDSMYEKKNGYSIKDSNDDVMKIYSNKMAKTNFIISDGRLYADAKVCKNYFLNTDDPKIVFIKNNEIYDQVPIDNNIGQYQKSKSI